MCLSTCRTALETIEKLTATLDFTDFSSQIIHAIVEVSSMVVNNNYRYSIVGEGQHVSVF